jgi:hypothetical protein
MNDPSLSSLAWLIDCRRKCRQRLDSRDKFEFDRSIDEGYTTLHTLTLSMNANLILNLTLDRSIESMDGWMDEGDLHLQYSHSRVATLTLHGLDHVVSSDDRQR